MAAVARGRDAGYAAALTQPPRSRASVGAQGDGGHRPFYERTRWAAAACRSNAEYRLLNILMSFDGDGLGVRQSVRNLAKACGKINVDGQATDLGYVANTLKRLCARGFVSVETSAGSKPREITIHYDAICAANPAATVRETPNTTVRETPNTTVRKTPNTTVRKTPNTTVRKTPNTVLTMEHRNSVREWCDSKGYTTNTWSDAQCKQAFERHHPRDPA